MDDFEQQVTLITNEIKDLLISKNKSYGNSALEPVRIFSKASPIAQIEVRIDDKLSRIANGNLSSLPSESRVDTINDLIGYLILYRIALIYQFIQQQDDKDEPK